MVFLTGGIFIFWDGVFRPGRTWHSFFLCGLLCGCAMLIRPIAIGITLVMGVIIWFINGNV